VSEDFTHYNTSKIQVSSLLRQRHNAALAWVTL